MIREASSIRTKQQNELIWSERGYCSFSGSCLELYGKLDEMFCRWASRVNARHFQFPDFIAREALDKTNYFESFGHLATSVESSQETLTPAACYHFYSALEHSRFDSAQYLTTRANCFRREEYYEPLRRQWCFGMREIICIGSKAEVQRFLADYRRFLEMAAIDLELPVKFQVATDPFFNPENSPGYIMQLIDPVKHEMVYEDNLAIGSINYHRNRFGEAFDLQVEGEIAHSACVAFGLERWMFALMNTHGEKALKLIEEFNSSDK